MNIWAGSRKALAHRGPVSHDQFLFFILAAYLTGLVSRGACTTPHTHGPGKSGKWNRTQD